MIEVSYSVEKWDDVVKSLDKIFEIHYAESGDDNLEFNMDYDAYQALSDNGKLVLFIIRIRGEIVGYYTSILSCGLHNKYFLNSYNDIHFLLKEYRLGYIWANFLKFIEKHLASIGVCKIYTGVRLICGNRDRGKILKRGGYIKIEELWCKNIGV